jgi:glyceraldehyde 3-phosphate dehydrogenase
MAVKVGINGYGRIGRNILRALYEAGRTNEIQIVGINDLGDANTNAHLTRFDTAHGRFPGEVAVDGDSMVVNGDRIRVLKSRDPAALPWGELGVDVVLECTGLFTTKEKASAHLKGGAKKVVISAPGGKDVDATVVYGVNHDVLRSDMTVISNASCTTNCFVPLVKVLDDAFGVEGGLMTTIHAYTGDQALVDGPHSDLRRARGAAINIIPTSTGAARATSLVMESMKGKLDGTSLRVPIPTGSITDFVANLKKPATVEEINAAFKKAAEGELKGILEYTDEPIVSSDVVTNPHSCVFDSGLTMSMGTMVKVLGWYDNEWGYSNRLVDLSLFVGKKLKG